VEPFGNLRMPIAGFFQELSRWFQPGNNNTQSIQIINVPGRAAADIQKCGSGGMDSQYSARDEAESE